MKVSNQEWIECLESLNFTEQKSAYGCYNIFDDNNIPKWQYETEEEKKNLYYFFSGMIYMRMKQKFIKEEKIQKPCINCIYFKECGESGRTEPCKGRMTKRELKKENKR